MFYIQVKTQTPDGKKWKYLQPTNGARYEYKTRWEASKIANMCYPMETENEVRVVEE